jgi:hypothetical protein
MLSLEVDRAEDMKKPYLEMDACYHRNRFNYYVLLAFQLRWWGCPRKQLQLRSGCAGLGGRRLFVVSSLAAWLQHG